MEREYGGGVSRGVRDAMWCGWVMRGGALALGDARALESEV